MLEDTSTSSPGTFKENNLSIPLFQSAEWKVRAEVGEEVREESAEESEVLSKGTAHHLSGNKHRKKNRRRFIEAIFWITKRFKVFDLEGAKSLLTRV